MSGSHTSAPMPVYTMSNRCPPKAATASYTSETTNAASMPSERASEAAADTAGAEKSSPLTSAPRRAQDSVSSPMWHCRCTSRFPVTSPASAASKGRSVLAPARKPSRS